MEEHDQDHDQNNYRSIQEDIERMVAEFAAASDSVLVANLRAWTAASRIVFKAVREIFLSKNPSWTESFKCWFFRVERKSSIFPEPKFGRRLRRSAGRCFSLFLLVIPKKRRDEIVGDFHESLHKANQAGYGRFARTLLAIAKFGLYGWVSLNLRASDFAHSEEEQDQLETPD